MVVDEEVNDFSVVLDSVSLFAGSDGDIIGWGGN